MTSQDDNKTRNQAELDAESLRLMNAFATRSGDGEAGLDEPLDDALEAELADYMALSRRIDEVDREPVAASVRGVVMSEAARVLEAREQAAEPNGLVAMLMALLRPGPVLAVAALVALGVAIQVRQEHVPLAEGPAAAVAMHEAEPTMGRPTAAAAAAPRGAAAEPAAPPAAEVANAAAAAEPTRDEAAPAGGSAGEPAEAERQAAAADTPAEAAPEQALRERVVAEAAKAPTTRIARPKRAIAARPAAVDPAGTPPPDDSVVADNKLEPVAEKKAVEMDKLAAAPAPSAQAYREVAAAKVEAEVVPAAKPAAAPRVQATGTASAAPAPSMPARRVADSSDDVAADRADKDEVESLDDGKQLTRQIDALRKQIAKVSSSSERVRLLERLVKLLERAGDNQAAATARKDLAAARAELVTDSPRAKAAPMQKARSAPTAR